MNSSEHNSPTSGGSPVPPELEARLLAWIAGEASPFEVAELERLVREQPAVADAKHALEATHTLLTTAAKPDAAPLRLSAERRAKLLQEIATAAERTAPPDAVLPNPRASRDRQHRRSWWLVAAASCAVVTFLLVLDPTELFRGYHHATTATRLTNDDSLRQTERERAQQEAAGISDRRKELLGQRDATTEPDRQRSEKKRRQENTGAGQSTQPAPKPAKAEGPRRNASEPLPASSAQPDFQLADKPVNTFGIELPKTNAPLKDYPRSSSQPASPAPGSSLFEKNATAAPKTDGVSFPGGFDSATTPAAVDTLRFRSFYDHGFVGPAELGQPVPLERHRDPLELLKQEFAWKTKTSASEEFQAAPRAKQQRLAGALPNTDSRNDRVGGIPREFSADRLDSNVRTIPEVSLISQSSSLLRAEPGRQAVLDAASKKDWNETPGNLLHFWKAQEFDGDPATPAHPSARGSLHSAIRDPLPRSLAILAMLEREQTGQPAAGPTPTAVVTDDHTTTTDDPVVRAPRIALPPLEEIAAGNAPVSTFSLHVGDVSFRLAQKALAAGRLPATETVRIEEFVNAFRYGDLSPTPAAKIAARIEQSAHPLRQQRNLVRIAAKVPATGRDAVTPLRLTVLLDTSGSMEREDRAATVRAALKSLAALLTPHDQLTLVGFSRTTRILADSVPGDQVASTLGKLGAVPSDGGTNLEEALRQATTLALQRSQPTAQNRVVLLTDGAANLGNADPEKLARFVTMLRENRIAFDACGVGLDGLDDSVLEALTRQGDGRYYVLDTPAAADAGFARQLAGAFRPAAANVKVQVRFNPARVGAYRLLGFEKHRLNEEDFRNDAIDAAELAAEEDASAVYEVEARPDGTGELGDLFIRFRDTATGEMVERSWTMTYDAGAPSLDRASPTLQLAGTTALFAQLLRDRPADLGVRLAELAPNVAALRTQFPSDARVAEFVTMFEQARRIAGR